MIDKKKFKVKRSTFQNYFQYHHDRSDPSTCVASHQLCLHSTMYSTRRRRQAKLFWLGLTDTRHQTRSDQKRP